MHLDLLGVFTAGLLTFASPCILPLLPVYLGLLGGATVGELRTGARVGRTVLAASAFALGLAAVFVALGMAATAAGRALVGHRALLMQLGGLAVFLFGLKLLGALHLPFLDREARPGFERLQGGGLAGAFVMGAAFALGWTPCVGPILGSVLTFAAAAGTSPAQGALYLGTYAAGLALPMIAAAAVAPLALRILKGALRWMRPLQLASGGLLALVGLLLITDSLGAVTPSALASPMSAPEASEAPKAIPVEAGAACAEAASGPGACGLPAETAGAPQEAPQGLAVIEFVSNRCPICQRMAPVVRAAERRCAGRSVSVVRVEVDRPGGRELARRHQVLGVPTFVFQDAKGREVARLVGEQPLATLEQSLAVLSGEECSGFGRLPEEPAPAEPPAS